MAKKIVFLSHLDLNLYLFRLPIMQELVKLGWQVIALTPKGAYSDKFAQHGITHLPYSIDRGSLNPFKELVTIYRIQKILKQQIPDVVHAFTVKPNIYGAIAAKLAKVPLVVITITGLGSFFIEKGLKSFFIRKLILFLYKTIARFAHKVIFQNSDDLKLFVQQKIVRPEQAVVILGSGIDTQLWQPVAKMAKVNQPVKVIMVGRLLIHKGVREYLAMAKVLKQKYQDRAEFWLIGDYYDGNPYNMSKELMDNAIKQGEIKFLSWSDRVRELLAESDIFVLPSYREGVPRTALEAAAMGKPIVTTDAVGCKEVVVDGVNGYLVPVQDSQVLSEKVGLLIENAALREKMGLASRKLAEERFDVQAVIKQYLAIYH